MKWRAAPSRAKERANISFFIFIMFFAVFGVIILTELLPLERPNEPTRSRNEHLQGWDGKTNAGNDETESPLPAHAPLDAVWQPVDGTRFRFYVYSAYVERRTVAAVRIIAATKTRGADNVLCRLWLADNRTLTLKAKVKAIRENWNLKFSATYVLCLLRGSGVKPQETVGASVAVVASSKPNNPPTNLLVVLDTEPKTGLDETLHICVKPFHYSFNRNEWLVEWFEINRLLGASHFYMYNESLSATVACLLDDYRKQGLVTLLSWKLPIMSKVEIRTEGQFAAFNDCLYRSMSRTGWLLVIDVDEVVFPRRERNLPALLTALRASYNPPSKAPSAFLFRNAFFYTIWEDDPENKVPLLTARKTRRWTTPHALKNRSKYALRPREAVELGNHFVWELAPGASSVGVNNDRALLHHYRLACEFGGSNCLKVPSTIDRTAHRWRDELQQHVTAERKRIATICPTYFFGRKESDIYMKSFPGTTLERLTVHHKHTTNQFEQRGKGLTEVSRSIPNASFHSPKDRNSTVGPSTKQITIRTTLERLTVHHKHTTNQFEQRGKGLTKVSRSIPNASFHSPKDRNSTVGPSTKQITIRTTLEPLTVHHKHTTNQFEQRGKGLTEVSRSIPNASFHSPKSRNSTVGPSTKQITIRTTLEPLTVHHKHTTNQFEQRGKGLTEVSRSVPYASFHSPRDRNSTVGPSTKQITIRN